MYQATIAAPICRLRPSHISKGAVPLPLCHTSPAHPSTCKTDAPSSVGHAGHPGVCYAVHHHIPDTDPTSYETFLGGVQASYAAQCHPSSYPRSRSFQDSADDSTHFKGCIFVSGIAQKLPDPPFDAMVFPIEFYSLPPLLFQKPPKPRWENDVRPIWKDGVSDSKSAQRSWRTSRVEGESACGAEAYGADTGKDIVRRLPAALELRVKATVMLEKRAAAV
ncbi:hypothetical protein JB92DRAFT_2831692 [Gautieria morchelliformis]|nr:hypothetical protein JB92DRAFT_2831692 [Gautieria morchelliformis]